MSASLLTDLSGNILAFIAGIILYKRLAPGYRLVWVQVAVSLLLEFTTAFVIPANNQWVYNLYVIADCGILLSAIHIFLNKRFFLQIMSAFMIFLAVWGVCIFYSGISEFAIVAYVFYSVLLIVLFSIITYMHILHYKGDLIKSPILWLFIGTSVFYACNIPFFSSLAIFQKTHTDTSLLYMLKLRNLLVILGIVRYCLTALSFYLQSRKANKAA